MRVTVAPASRALWIAEDDLDDRLLLEDAFREARVSVPLRFADDGEALLDALRAWANGKDPFVPALVLMDLNMPLLDGHETLQQLKADPRLRHIPVVMLTTSHAPHDVELSYSYGASSFISKPVTFEGLVELADTLNQYWLRTVRLP